MTETNNGPTSKTQNTRGSGSNNFFARVSQSVPEIICPLHACHRHGVKTFPRRRLPPRRAPTCAHVFTDSRSVKLGTLNVKRKKNNSAKEPYSPAMFYFTAVVRKWRTSSSAKNARNETHRGPSQSSRAVGTGTKNLIPGRSQKAPVLILYVRKQRPAGSCVSASLH